MEAQGLTGAWLFPTLGVGMEEALAHDGKAAMAAFSAFNTWLDEDWGYAYQDRLFAAPYLCLMDLDGALAELRTVFGRGARIICLRPAPVHTASGTTSPFTEEYDPFWSAVEEAGITVAFHGGDSGYAAHVDAWEPDTEAKAFFATPLYRCLLSNRAITETMLALLCHRLLERHPGLRIASIENGAGWVAHMLRLVEKAEAMTPGWFAASRPSCSTGTCGSPRSGRTDRSPRSRRSARTAPCSGPTGRTPKVWRTRFPTGPSWQACRRRRSTGSWAATPSS